MKHLILTTLLTLATHAEAAQEFSGILVSTRRQDVSPQGEWWEFLVKQLAAEGSRVRKGDLIAEFEEKANQEWLSRMRTDLQNSRVEWQTGLSEIEAEIESLQGQISEKKRELSVRALGAGEPDPRRSERERKADALNLERLELELANLETRLAGQRRLLGLKRKVAEASLARTEKRLEAETPDPAKAKTTAAFDGVVMLHETSGRGKAKVGTQVYRGMVVLSVVDDTALEAHAFIEETRRDEVRPGDHAEVRILGKREVTVPGRVVSVSSVVKTGNAWEAQLPSAHPFARTRCFLAKVAIDSVPPEARPNGSVEIRMANKGRSQ